MQKGMGWERHFDICPYSGYGFHRHTVYASPARQVTRKQEEKILLPEKKTVTSIDFTEMENLDSLPEGMGPL